ncbi:hypothetical protein D3C79_966330 [compost metagenome]
MSFKGLNPDFHDSANTSAQANAPPIKANTGVMKNNAGKKEIIKSCTNAAPEDIPITPASANGLRITDCNRTPETDNAAPANRATIMRGNRKSRIASI